MACHSSSKPRAQCDCRCVSLSERHGSVIASSYNDGSRRDLKDMRKRPKDRPSPSRYAKDDLVETTTAILRNEGGDCSRAYHALIRPMSAQFNTVARRFIQDHPESSCAMKARLARDSCFSGS